MSSSKRNTLLFIVVAIIAGVLFQRADSFWGVLFCALCVIWGLVYLLPVMDGTWRLKVGFVVALFFGALVVLVPTITGMIPDGKAPWLTNNFFTRYVNDNIASDGGFAIAPGLDLKGGLRLVYTVGVDDAINDKRDNAADDMRQMLATSFGLHEGSGHVTRDELAKLSEKATVSTPSTAQVRIHFTDVADKSKVDDRFIEKFNEFTHVEGASPNDLVFKLSGREESQIREKAVEQAKNTVHKRIDELGLREANVAQRDEDIIIEVPGTNPEAFKSIKEIIAKTARLEFKMVDDPTDWFGPNVSADNSTRKGTEWEKLEVFLENAPFGYGDSNGKKVQKTIPTHNLRLMIDKDLDKDPEGRKQPLDMCKDRLKRFIATLPKVPDEKQIGFEEVDSAQDPETGKVKPEGWRTLFLEKHASVTGDYITDAQVGQDTQGAGGYFVSMNFNAKGAELFEEITGSNIGKRFAIILDDVVDSAPVIQSKISGSARITMGSGDPVVQLEKAHQLELVLRAGALPAPIYASSETVIGASLGEDAIAKGTKGALVGTGLVLAFMILYYRKAGVVADLAVLFNLVLQLAVLASFGATMTLPGIAGLTLTIGMAVDANVLINERIREELRAGRSVRAAVEAGYGKAFTSIIDGHVTVFISGLILAQYGTGPVKGFAVTLLVGIIASLFTGVFCTRLVFDWWTRGAKVKKLSVGAEF